jgi:hypothetical protein
MLRAWGVAGKAAVLVLCALVAAQAFGVFSASAHGPRPCHDERAAAAQASQAEHHTQAGHMHASDSRGHATHHAAQAQDEGAADTDNTGKSHSSGCCGWLCSAALLTPSHVIRPALVPGSGVAFSPTSATENARPQGLFRPPRMFSGIIA